MEKLIDIIKKFIADKFTGRIEINFNQGGITGIYEVRRKKIN